MFCVNCNRDLVHCECPNALERITWVMGPKSPVTLGVDYANRLYRRKIELEGHKELDNIGESK